MKWFTCSEHDRRVAVVGAADNGGDDHGAVCQLILLTTVHEGNTDLLLLLGDVEAFKTHLSAKTTAPFQTSNKLYLSRRHHSNPPLQVKHQLKTPGKSLLDVYLLVKTTLKVLLHAANSHPVLRSFRSTDVGNYGAQVDFYHLHTHHGLHVGSVRKIFL